MHKRSLVTIQLFCFALSWAPAMAQQVGAHDLCNIKVRDFIRPPVAGSGSGGGIGVGGDQVQPSPPVVLDLLSVVRDSSGRLSYHVRIKNRGQANVVIPWGVHPRDFEPKDATRAFSFRRTDISMWMVRTSVSHSDELLGVTSLYGSEEVQGSLRKLRTGEWLTVRGCLPLPNTGAPSGTMARKNSVRAKVAFSASSVKLRGDGHHIDSRPVPPEVPPSDALPF